jgi:hypothetical protein
MNELKYKKNMVMVACLVVGGCVYLILFLIQKQQQK